MAHSSAKRSAEKLKDAPREKYVFARRIGVSVAVGLALTAALLFRLIELQVVNRDYYSTRAEENRLRLSPVPPVRGQISDRNGVLLAENKPAFVLEIVPEQVRDMDALLGRLGELIDLDDSEVERFRDRVSKSPRYRAVPLRNNLTEHEVASFQLNRYAFPGVDVNAKLSRSYPLGETAAHVIGYVGGITEQELQRVDPTAYQGLSQIGKVGVERSHEDHLRGSPGTKIIEANAYGRPLREVDYRRGAPGQNLVLTIDAQVQAVAEQALGELAGAVVALDPRNGNVIALVSMPTFDPQLFVGGIDHATYRTLLNDRGRPLYNRALQGAYPPGSTIKPFMALAGLEYAEIQPSHSEYCSGSMSVPNTTRRYRCWKRTGHGWMNMAAAVTESCDIYFYRVAETLGIHRIHDFMGRFGLGAPTHVDLPLERSGLLPSAEWKKRTHGQIWYPGETLNVGIGQGYMTTTPMQLAQITARMAMRGRGYQPHIVLAREDALSGQVTRTAPIPLDAVPHGRERDWETVIHSMEQVTRSVRGTAQRIFRDAPYRVAGKTGTAQVAGMSQEELRARRLEETPFHLRDHALFVAFAPVEDPSIAVAVIAEHAGHGGSAAAPIARKVMDQYLLGEVRYDAPPPTIPPLARARLAGGRNP